MIVESVVKPIKLQILAYTIQDMRMIEYRPRPMHCRLNNLKTVAQEYAKYHFNNFWKNEVDVYEQ